MGYILYTCEKPSIGKDIAKIVGASEKKDGYLEGNNCIVTWTLGHLCELYMPGDYKDEWKQWDLAQIPMVPEQFLYGIKNDSGIRKQFTVMANLMKRDDVDYIVDCGDAGREGVYIQGLVRNLANCKKPVKRLWISSFTEKSVKDGLKNLHPINEYEKIYEAASARAIADWLIGMNFSRFYTKLYNASYPLSVGRVQTPTLALVVKRYIDNKKFVAQKYFTLTADFGEFSASWKNPDPENKKITDESEIDSIIANISGKTGILQNIEKKKKTTERPLLYDLTELQRDGSRIFGYHPDEVLDTAQSLYETHKLTTYPRTDSRYLTEDLKDKLPVLVKGIKEKIPGLSEVTTDLLKNGLNIDQRIIDETKVSDHHAIIITENISRYHTMNLSEMEQNIALLIMVRMLETLSGKYAYMETSISIQVENEIFTASGKIPIEHGFKKITQSFFHSNKNDEADGASEFPEMEKGQELTIKKLLKKSAMTTPPKLHTDDTLLTAMEHARNEITDEQLKKAIGNKGIGTPATRASIISELLKKEYIVRTGTGKIQNIIPTNKGISLISILPAKLISPTLTAEWEMKLTEIEEGNENLDSFIHEMVQFITEITQTEKAKEINMSLFHQEEKSLGKCPWCGKAVIEKNKVFTCSECNFTIWKNDNFISEKQGSPISEKQISELLKNGNFKTKCNGEKGNYEAFFSINPDDKTRVSWEIKFPPRKRRKKGIK